MRWKIFVALRESLKMRPVPNWDVADKYLEEEYRAFKRFKEDSKPGEVKLPDGVMVSVAVVEAVDRTMMDEHQLTNTGTKVAGTLDDAICVAESPSSRRIRVGNATSIPNMKSSDQCHVMWVRRVHPDARLPRRSGDCAAGMDLYACTHGDVPSDNKTHKVNIGIQIALPRGTLAYVKSRSSVAIKNVDVCAGVIDEDYRGDLQVVLKNTGKGAWNYAPGERIAQLVIHKKESPNDTGSAEGSRLG